MSKAGYIVLYLSSNVTLAILVPLTLVISLLTNAMQEKSYNG